MQMQRSTRVSQTVKPLSSRTKHLRKVHSTSQDERRPSDSLFESITQRQNERPATDFHFDPLERHQDVRLLVESQFDPLDQYQDDRESDSDEVVPLVPMAQKRRISEENDPSSSRPRKKSSNSSPPTSEFRPTSWPSNNTLSQLPPPLPASSRNRSISPPLSPAPHSQVASQRPVDSYHQSPTDDGDNAQNSRLEDMVSNAQNDVIRAGQLKTMSKRKSPASSLKLSRLTDLCFDASIVQVVEEALSSGVERYQEPAAVAGYLGTFAGSCAKWPDISAGLVHWWKVQGQNNIVPKFDRRSFPRSLKQFPYALGIIHTGGAIKTACIPARKDKSQFISSMVRRILILLVRIASTVGGGMDISVKFFEDYQNTITGLIKEMRPSEASDVFLRICNFFSSKAETLENALYPLIDLICKLIATALRRPYTSSILERVHVEAFDLIYEYELPAECNTTRAHSILSRLIVAATRQHRDEHLVWEALVNKYNKMGSRNHSKGVLKGLKEDWVVTWNAVKVFHEAAPFILAGYFGQWDGSAPEVQNGIFGNIEALFPIPGAGATAVRALLREFPMEPISTTSWRPLEI
ncbi:hypothetical protein DFS34DRAFT_635686 [Phlyctochytrium arcticum]|nr:hypothetical protein DFS34DRAFT_635686 [Phlyctochytrium arcticum]